MYSPSLSGDLDERGGDEDAVGNLERVNGAYVRRRSMGGIGGSGGGLAESVVDLSGLIGGRIGGGGVVVTRLSGELLRESFAAGLTEEWVEVRRLMRGVRDRGEGAVAPGV